MKSSLPALGFWLLFLVCPVLQGETPPAADDQAALELGKVIITVDKALEYDLPENPTPAEKAKFDALTKAMVEAGQLTRMYPWVIARIGQEIATTEHLLQDTSPDAQRARKLAARLTWLKRVKLLIDAPL